MGEVAVAMMAEKRGAPCIGGGDRGVGVGWSGAGWTPYWIRWAWPIWMQALREGSSPEPFDVLRDTNDDD
jgi:hypothetical protein